MSIRNETVIYAARTNVRPDPNNLKTHTEANIAHIMDSIEKFGFADPIGVVENPDAVEGGYVVVEGHGRLEAATRMGLHEVPIIVLDLDDAKRRGYGIAHNQIQQITGMDHAAVASEFERLGVGPEDYSALGYSEEDVMFLPQVGSGDQFSAPDGGEYQEQEDDGAGDIGTNSSLTQGYAPVVHKSALRFASDTSYNRFIELLAQMRINNPLAASISERLTILMDDLGVGQAATEGENTDADNA